MAQTELTLDFGSMRLRIRLAAAQNIRCAAALSWAAGVFLPLCTTPARAQFLVPGSVAADRARLYQIVGDTSRVDGARLLALGALVPPLRGVPAVGNVIVVMPDARVTWNSDIPYSLNDGALWAGRGWNATFTGGLAIAQPYRGMVLSVALAPTVAYSQNLPFQIFPGTTPGRSAFANFFHGPDASLDLPHRFGDRHVLGVFPGRSGASVAWPRVVAGITSDNQWWGPGIRNALVMSNNAPGIPRLFVRTGEPLRSAVGEFEAELISGTLTQSLFFSDLYADNRTLSGVFVRLRPRFDSTLTLGFARVVYAPIGPEASPFTMTLARSFDAIVRWENVNRFGGQRSDQIYSAMARWIFPRAGLEVYGEWARMDLPRNLTEFVVAGHNTGGYTLGFQWAQTRSRGAYLRLQSEITYLEQSLVFPDRPPPDFYTGIASPQGYTQRGQVIGASIGPGASSQWIAVDYMPRKWQAGAFIGRIRWDNDALYRQGAPTFLRHDVTVLSGLRGAWRAPFTDFAGEMTFARRYNYLFQNGFANPGGFRTVDVNNFTVTLSATPR